MQSSHASRGMTGTKRLWGRPHNLHTEKDPTAPMHTHTKKSPVTLTLRCSWSYEWITSTNFTSYTDLLSCKKKHERSWKRVAVASPVMLLNSDDKLAERWGQCLWSEFLAQLPPDTCHRFNVSCYLKLRTHTHTKKMRSAILVQSCTCPQIALAITSSHPSKTPFKNSARALNYFDSTSAVTTIQICSFLIKRENKTCLTIYLFII